MTISIKATNLKLTPTIRQYIEEKIGSLAKFAKILSKEDGYDISLKKKQAIVEIQVEVGKTTFHHRKGKIFRAEVQLKMFKKNLRAESINENLFSSINEAKDEIERQIKQYQDKATVKYKRGARRLKKDLRLSPTARFYRKGRIREEGI